jgi:hypothetical protein
MLKDLQSQMDCANQCLCMLSCEKEVDIFRAVVLENVVAKARVIRPPYAAPAQSQYPASARMK